MNVHILWQNSWKQNLLHGIDTCTDKNNYKNSDDSFCHVFYLKIVKDKDKPKV